MIKRVLLINPPDTRPPDLLANKVRVGMVPPLGLAYIAAVLERAKIDVKILDCVAEGWGKETKFFPQPDDYPFLEEETRYGLEVWQIQTVIETYNPDLVGVSCLFSNKNWDARDVCRIAKILNPEIITVMGGSHATALSEDILQDPNIDVVCEGEGELALTEYIKDSNKNGKPDCNLIKAAMIDLDILPLPARHLLPMAKYLSGQSPHSGQKRIPATTITTSRGCPGRCSFCAIRCTFGDAYRRRSPTNVLAEIEHLIEAYHIRELHFEDDNLTADKKRALAIFQGIIDRRLDLTLNCPSGLAIFAMDEELIDKMREAGFYSLSFAIESGSPEVLKLMHKHVDQAKASRLIAYARSLGMKTKAFYILGYPGETKETMQRTLECAYQLGADWSLFFPATPLPGTEMLEVCQRNGWLADPGLDYRYYFHRANIRTPEFGPEDVMALREKGNRELNFEQNVNVREGKYARAIEDFQEIVKLYPNLEMARRALEVAQARAILSKEEND